MTKIPTVREMEELLLRDSTTDDLMPVMPDKDMPEKQITVAVGMNYRKLLQEDFELNGHKPNIKCPDGTDAFAVAMTEIEKSKTLQSQTPER